jgi:hypothetical protein
MSHCGRGAEPRRHYAIFFDPNTFPLTDWFVLSVTFRP